MLQNSSTRFGTVAIIFHWLIALGVITEFAMGLYMTSLTYYDDFYYILPRWHEGIGILLAALVVLRILWSIVNRRPEAGSGVKHWEHLLSRAVHFAMHCLLVAILLFGYLWSTAEGEPVQVFDWFAVPPITGALQDQESRYAFWHYWLAWAVMSFASLHAAGAIKHHLIDKDQTLTRMLGR